MNKKSIFIAIALMVLGPAGISTTLAAAPVVQQSTAPASNSTDDKALYAQYQVWLGRRNFDELDKAGNQLLTRYRAKEITADTLTSQLLLMVPNDPKMLLGDTEAWVKAKPKSYTAHYVLGVDYIALARQARGGKLARDTSSAQIAEMERYFGQALEMLNKSIALDTKPYPSYRSLVTIAGMLGDHAAADMALSNAVKTDLDATGAYLRYIEYNTPRWGGDYNKLEKLLVSARKSGMSKQNLAVLESEILVWRARDEVMYSKNPGRAVDYWLAAYKANPGKQQVGHLYAAASDAKAAKQIDRALAIYTQIATEFKDEDTAFALRGNLYHEEKQDYKRAFDDFLVAANMGNKFSQNNVGFYYMTGKAGMTDLVLARKYFQLSADQGFDHAKEKLKLLDAMQAKK